MFWRFSTRPPSPSWTVFPLASGLTRPRASATLRANERKSPFHNPKTKGKP